MGTLLGGLVATLLGLRGGAPPVEALLLGLPLGFALAALCLVARYPARAVPLAPGKMMRVAATHLSAAVACTAAWVTAGFGLARLLGRLPAHAGAASRFAGEAPTLLLAGGLIFLLAVTAHYLLIALEAAREAEVRGVQARVLAREAELRALRSQVDPHFLFNCLNSIGTLTAEDPPAARRMCLLLASFLRRSLALGRCEQILLGEEMDLVSDYLAIESIRFGPRLRVSQLVEEECRNCPVPPLLLQPVVENAVRHGIAQILEGGTLAIAAGRDREGVVVTVENPRDPDLSGGPGAGLGLENVRSRLRTLHGDGARLDVTAAPTTYRVRLLIPWTPAAGSTPRPEAGTEAPDGGA